MLTSFNKKSSLKNPQTLHCNQWFSKSAGNSPVADLICIKLFLTPQVRNFITHLTLVPIMLPINARKGTRWQVSQSAHTACPPTEAADLADFLASLQWPPEVVASAQCTLKATIRGVVWPLWFNAFISVDCARFVLLEWTSRALLVGEHQTKCTSLYFVQKY